LNRDEEKTLDFLKEEIVKKIKYFKDDVEDPKENERRLRSLIQEILLGAGKKLGEESTEKIYFYLYCEFIGYGRISVMMLDPNLEDVSCDGTGIPIYVFHRKFKNIKTNIIYMDKAELDNFAIRLAQRSGKHISIAQPVLDATLPDGSRLNETFGTIVTTRGTSFTIRKFKEDPLTMADLVGWKTLSKEMAAHLWLAVQYGESMMVSGGTASGKTTTLNAISHFIPPSAKVITIEDTREVQLPHENWIAGLTREKKGERGGMNIDMYALLIAALRQRPEYMIVGEVRGKETMAVFQAMATGQTTYATIHADSVASIIHRLENPPINIPRILILGLNLVLLQAQVKVKGRRTRRIRELAEIIGIEPTSNEIITNSIFKWSPAKDKFTYSGHSKLYEKIMDRENLTAEEVMQEVKQRTDVVDWLVKKEVRTHTQVAAIVNEYYRDPKTVVERCRRELEEMRTKAVIS
jgi:flagellar protein FlaI